ncbi:MAG: biopolymer transporter ExbD [Planctomycetota bacterium]
MDGDERSTDRAESDMTPMIDAVFLLIIFFLCIDFRVLEAKVPAYLPTGSGSSASAAQPQEQLVVRVLCENFGTRVPRYPGRVPSTEPGREEPFTLLGHRIFWTVEAQRVNSISDLERTLTRIAEDESLRIADDSSPGERKLLPVVLEPQDGATYGDVAATLDVIRHAEFDEVRFGSTRMD